MWIVLGAAALVAAGVLVGPYVRAASLVVRAGDLEGWIRLAAGLTTQDVETEDLTIATRHGRIRARAYRPSRRARSAVLLATGVNPAGIDEPRLRRLARELAATGVLIVTPELPGLVRFQLDRSSTDIIEDAAAWMAAEPGMNIEGRIGLMGVSFSGGLSVVAAGRPALRHKLTYVLSFGGHADLPRVLRFLAQGDQGRVAHDYGVAVLLQNAVARIDGFVPRDQVQPLLHSIEVFLRASHVVVSDAAAGEVLFRRARALAEELPEPAATLMRHVNDRDVKALGPKLLPHIFALGADPALSPERSPLPQVPVYLLHGRDDPVIPSSESQKLADRLRPHVKVTLLQTRLIAHAEADRTPALRDVWEVVGFWAKLLEER